MPNDPYLSSYMNVKAGMVKGCSKSASTAASSYLDLVRQNEKSAEGEEYQEQLASLDAILAPGAGDPDR